MAAALPYALIAMSTMASANAAKQNADIQAANFQAKAQADQFNATVAANNARVAAEQANAQEEAQRRKFRDVQGRAYAAIAQSGTGFDGSNLDLLHQNEVNAELDALTIRYDGQNKTRGLMDQSAIDRYSAGTNLLNAGAAQKAGKTAVAAAILNGASQSYMAYNKVGLYKD